MTINAVSSDSSTSMVSSEVHQYLPKHKIRFITATSLFDGHDASINIIRRLLQQSGCEVIHLGHNRSVSEIVTAAIQEDAQGIAISSYQGGHMEFFRYILDSLKERHAGQIKVFGGGGGTIIPEEIRELESCGVKRIFSPEDGAKLGLQGMVNLMIEATDFDPISFHGGKELTALADPLDQVLLAHYLTQVESGTPQDRQKTLDLLQKSVVTPTYDQIPVIGITGTGGAGKSSLTDELVLRFLNDIPDLRIAVLSVDPSKKKTGGALLGDRIRMNAILNPKVFMRSFATRGSQTELAEAIPDAIKIMRAAGFDLILVETTGIGQGDSEVTKIADISLYVMTPEYGAASQLEKIEMLDLANIVIINKFDRHGADDALRDVRRQFRRTHDIKYDIPDDNLPVFGTIASHFNDRGVNALYLKILAIFNQTLTKPLQSMLSPPESVTSDQISSIVPQSRVRYLSEVAETVRNYKNRAEQQRLLVQDLFSLERVISLLKQDGRKSPPEGISQKIHEVKEKIDPELEKNLKSWEGLKKKYQQKSFTYQVREKGVEVPIVNTSLSGTLIRKVSLPDYTNRADLVRFLMLENLPGYFPFTAGVFPFKRTDEDPKRQFAGEGTPTRTNKRFHYLTQKDQAKRLSTAFDSVTLYGNDPDHRPDIFGKIGESGVSICTFEDTKKLYHEFDLCDPNTSVSMTINGPAPIILAFFFNTAFDQQIELFRNTNKRKPTEQEREEIIDRTLQAVRGTVQADILKEDQAQNTCIFSVEFALRMMGDIQEFFIKKKVRNYYSVSISGYHIAEAGANPITQLALTLANGFTYVEYYRSRGMNIDDFAPNLSFFFSNGLDAEYTVIGRVARRIWAISMKHLYKADERSQKLKYHIQTSGRSLHAQEVSFNDIRTTLQALIAFYDNCNSLHTNAYDEAVTTPTEESVRRAMAIQLIINREFGWAKNENPHQGSFFINELTDLVEEAVLAEFDRITSRGGVLGAMELGYQRGKIQEESLYYERLKHNGELPIIGVNTFLKEEQDELKTRSMKLSRSSVEEKDEQIRNLMDFHQRNKHKVAEVLNRLRDVATRGDNIFEELLNTVRFASLGQISQALFEIGGAYRRTM